MLLTYFAIDWRNLLKNKLFSVINVFGLALAMSVGVLVLIRMSDAFDYDNFHADQKNIYRVLSKITKADGSNWTMASSPLPLSGVMANEGLPVTLIYPAIHSTIKDASREFSCNGAFIEASFFEIFSFHLRSGSAASLNKPQQLLMSEQCSRKFFGDRDPMGKVVTIENFGEFEIAGIIQEPPSKSHIQYDVLVSMASLAQSKFDDWNSFELGYTYVKAVGEIEKEILTHGLQQWAGAANNISVDSKIEFQLQPLSSISPSPSDIYNDIGRSPSRGSLVAEMTIALVILVAACFNYTNLSIARAP